MSNIKYNKRTWLNNLGSHYTGSIVCSHFTDLENRGKHLDEYMFVEFSDCHSKIRIHKDNNLSKQDFVDKLKLIQNELQQFITHLSESE